MVKHMYCAYRCSSQPVAIGPHPRPTQCGSNTGYIFIYVYTHMVLILRGCMKPGSAKTVRPKTSRPFFARYGAWNFLVERRWLLFGPLCRLIWCVNHISMNCVYIYKPKTSRDTQRLLKIQETSFDKGLPGDPLGERVAWKFAVGRFLCLTLFSSVVS
jgi:hypothetical protein